MVAQDSLALTHSWPLYEAAQRLAPGGLFPFDALREQQGPAPDLRANPRDPPGLGLWSCDLRDNALRWSRAVYELFGLPAEARLSRALTVSLYLARSRAAMEELRAHAIRHGRGFTLDVQIRRPDGDVRWMRLSALPILAGRRVARLCGTKQDVTAEYDG